MAELLLLGLDTYSYHFASPLWQCDAPKPLSLTNYLSLAVDLEFDGVALADMAHFTDEDTPERLLSRANTRRLFVDLGTGGAEVEHLDSCLRLARFFGSSVLRTFVSIGKTWKDPDEYAQALDAVIANLRRIALVCEETGVSLAIENHQDLTSKELRELLDAVDHPMIGACLDTGNCLGVLEHPFHALQNLADRTLMVHLKSYALWPQCDQDGHPGYILLGVPIEHNYAMLRATLVALTRRSPIQVLHVNLETAVEFIPVTPDRWGWSDGHSEAAERVLKRYGIEPGPIDPAYEKSLETWVPRREMSVEELLALEDRLVRLSAEQAHRLLADVRRETGEAVR